MSDTVRLCRDCKHSVLRDDRDWVLMCQHASVWRKNGWALARPDGPSSNDGEEAATQRTNRSLLAPCGQKGKLWEPRS